MKIKVIDLLNKIANGEEVPKKILLNRIVFEYQGDDYLYKDEDKKEYWLFSACYTDKYMWLEDFLKDEVEIIEEDKKIEKLDIKQEKNIKNNWKWKCNGYNISTPQKIMADKLNELIDEINNLKEN